MRRAALFLLVALLGLGLSSLSFSISNVEAQASRSLSALQRGLGGVLLFLMMNLVGLIVRIIPGLAVLLSCYAGYRIYSAGKVSYRTAAGLVVAAGLTYALIRLGLRFEDPGELDGVAGVRSGELVLMPDGQVVLRPDPRQAGAEPGWQEALAQSIQMALMQGQEQVVLDFSRRGCQHCARQLPVLQEVIRSRATAAQQVADRDFLGGMATAPLRVFLLDAEEFPQLAKGFQVQAFPTLWIFGMPKVDPLVTQGFLEKAQLEDALQMEAMKRPQKTKKKKGFFKLR